VGARRTCRAGKGEHAGAADVGRDHIDPEVISMSKPVGPYTPLVRAGDWLVVSGQVGIEGGRLVTGGLEGELRQAIGNLRALLESANASLADVVKTTVFLLHMRDYALMNEIYVEEFGEHRPARSAVAVAELPIGALVEIEAWAYVGGR
jgi:2-iminobutanoate/2-iminopropanoate deaminase